MLELRSSRILHLAYRNLCTLTESSNVLTSQVLLSDENRHRCIECMKSGPPIGIKRAKSKTERKYAAVLIAVCTNEKDEPTILYTRRSVQLSRHVRQIAFPGGIRDPTDIDFIDCALRETEEEIGLPRDRVVIWGMGAMLNPPHTASIMPVVGSVPNLRIDELKLNPQEVEEAFLIPVSKFLQPGALKHTQFKGGYSASNFNVGSYRIWGITAFLTNVFLNCFLPKSVYNSQKPKYVKPFQFKH